MAGQGHGHDDVYDHDHPSSPGAVRTTVLKNATSTTRKVAERAAFPRKAAGTQPERREVVVDVDVPVAVAVAEEDCPVHD
jgi:hypothetical protein